MVYSVLPRSHVEGLPGNDSPFDPPKTFALKMIDKRVVTRDKKIHEVHCERIVLQHLNHEAIPKLYCSFHDTNKLYFLMEHIQNGTLADFMNRERIISVDMTRFFIAHLLKCLEYLHGEGIAHRDLKPGNLLFDDNMYIKVIDFATAKVLNPTLSASIPKRPVTNH